MELRLTREPIQEACSVSMGSHESGRLSWGRAGDVQLYKLPRENAPTFTTSNYKWSVEDFSPLYYYTRLLILICSIVYVNKPINGTRNCGWEWAALCSTTLLFRWSPASSSKPSFITMIVKFKYKFFWLAVYKGACQTLTLPPSFNTIAHSLMNSKIGSRSVLECPLLIGKVSHEMHLLGGKIRVAFLLYVILVETAV